MDAEFEEPVAAEDEDDCACDANWLVFMANFGLLFELSNFIMGYC
jgi:hypothetical protein